MSLRVMNLFKRVLLDPMYRLEDQLVEQPGAVVSVAESPQRFDIPLEAMKRFQIGRPPMTVHTAPHMVGSGRGIWRSLRTLGENPAHPKTHIALAELDEWEALARSLNVAAVGYTRLPPRLVFRGKAVLFDRVMVLVMEMDRDKIETAPAPRASEAVHETYHYLGDAANTLAEALRRRGYAAQAGHPLNGLVLYPPLGQMAGLGWRGRHGMLITSQFGPRMRLAAVFTNIQNLPFFEGENPHRWIESFCEACGRCVRQCPVGAILPQPQQQANGLWRCTDVDKCFPFFLTHYGCSVCIRICPFNRLGYETLQARWNAK